MLFPSSPTHPVSISQGTEPSPTKMSTTATEVNTGVTVTGTQPKGRMALDGSPTNYGDFRDALNRDGYAVIKGAVPRDRARKYADEFYTYLEGLYGPPLHHPSIGSPDLILILMFE